MDISSIHNLLLNSSGLSIDTRQLKNNSIYLAIKGEKFDGNEFVQEALNKGACYVIVDNPNYQLSDKVILVKNTLNCLQQLASYHRNYLDIPIIGITGSNGKTTTKELVYSILSQKYKTVATKGNLNNHIGVPLTILNMDSSTQICIVEMGASNIYEIKKLAIIAQPNYGYITNFGKAHLKGFKNLNGVIKGKSELYNFLKNNNGTAFINIEDPIQIKQSKGINRVFFGKGTQNQVSCIESNPNLKVTFGDQKISTNLIGDYNTVNIAAAITIGAYFKIPLDLIRTGIENYKPENNRSQIIQIANIKLILDAYNANPTSMEIALKNFNSFNRSYKIICIADMLETGEKEYQEHQNIVNLCSSLNFNEMYFIGKVFSKTTISKGYKFDSFENFTKSFPVLSSYKKKENAIILVKGSRKMELERIKSIL